MQTQEIFCKTYQDKSPPQTVHSLRTKARQRRWVRRHSGIALSNRFTEIAPEGGAQWAQSTTHYPFLSPLFLVQKTWFPRAKNRWLLSSAPWPTGRKDRTCWSVIHNAQGYRVGLPLVREVLKIRIWGVPMAGGQLLTALAGPLNLQKNASKPSERVAAPLCIEQRSCWGYKPNSHSLWMMLVCMGYIWKYWNDESCITLTKLSKSCDVSKSTEWPPQTVASHSYWDLLQGILAQSLERSRLLKETNCLLFSQPIFFTRPNPNLIFNLRLIKLASKYLLSSVNQPTCHNI